MVIPLKKTIKLNDIEKKIFGEIFMEGDEEEKSCLSVRDISQKKLEDEFFSSGGV
jgi:hypothetical protein